MPPDIYPSTAAGKSYYLKYDSPSETMIKATWKLGPSYSNCWAVDSGSGIDFDVRVAEFNGIYGLVRQDEYVYISLVDLIGTGYNDDCITPLHTDLATTGEVSPGKCRNFYFFYHNMRNDVNQCWFNANYKFETCEYCKWALPDPHFNDASGGIADIAQASSDQCFTETTCTSNGYRMTLVTTNAIAYIATSNDIVRMQQTCVKCPHQCETCHWDFTGHDLVCDICITGSHKDGNRFVCDMSNCLYCNVTSCDL